MTNPFQDLIDQRQAHLAKASFLRKKQKQAGTRQHESVQARFLEKHRQDELVADLLKYLQQAVYPKLQLNSNDESWSIGLWMKGADGSSVWKAVLEVRLIYDEVDNRALYFECTRHNRQALAELSQPALQEALQKLYPRAEVRNRRLSRIREKSRFSAMVQEAFDDFKNEIPRDLQLASDAEHWSIGKYEITGTELAWKPVIRIRLRFDWKNKPKGFHCSAGKRRARAELSKEALANALNRVCDN